MAWRRPKQRQRDEIPSHHLAAAEDTQGGQIGGRPVVIGHAGSQPTDQYQPSPDRVRSTATVTLGKAGQTPPSTSPADPNPGSTPRHTGYIDQHPQSGGGYPPPTHVGPIAQNPAPGTIQHFGGTQYVPKAPEPGKKPEAPRHPAVYSEAALRAQEKVAAMGLSHDEILKYKKKFDVLDLNKDGVVSLREFAAVSKVLGYRFSRDEMKEIFGEKDLDDSGGITFDEFVLSMQERRRRASELDPLRAQFRIYDLENRGFITADECFPVLKRELGFDMNKAESFVDLFDKNRNYRLSMVEFPEFQRKVEELRAQVWAAFQDFDRNGDGFVDLEEMSAVLGSKGFTTDQVRVLIEKHDADADGKLNYQEFAVFWDIPIF